MNYIKEAEKYLYYYNELYRSLEHMRKERAKLIAKSCPSSNIVTKFDLTEVRANAHHDEAINDLYKIKVLSENIAETEKALAEVDKILEEISKDPGCELYGEVLRKWYIEKIPKEEIAEEIGYSENSRQSIYNIKNAAIRKFAVRLFGIGALKVV